MAGTRGRPRKSEARDTRQLIIEAALDVFAQQGYQGATVRHIARLVGIRESSIYAHFAGKAEILKAIVDAHGPAQPLNRLRTVMPDDIAAHPAEVIRRIGTAIANLWTQDTNLKFVRLMMMEQLSGSVNIPAEVRTSYQDISRAFVDMFRLMMDRGHIPLCEPVSLAAEFLGSLMHIRHEDVLMNPSPDLVKFRDQILAQVEHFIKRSGLA